MGPILHIVLFHVVKVLLEVCRCRSSRRDHNICVRVCRVLPVPTWCKGWAQTPLSEVQSRNQPWLAGTIRATEPFEAVESQKLLLGGLARQLRSEYQL